MTQPTYWKGGDWNAQCFRCGATRKASELRKQWQGYYVCPEHWEPRQPQDFVRAVPDNPGVPWSQPDSWEWVGPTCTMDGSSAMPALMMPGCSIPSVWFTYSETNFPAFCTATSVLAVAGIGTAGCATVGNVI